MKMEKDLKDILLKDLCARLPYNTKFRYEYVDSFGRTAYSTSIITGIRFPNYVEHCLFTGTDYLHIEKDVVKPYLFPLSSITEEQSMELFKLFGISLVDSIGADYIKINECTGITFFLNKGFDVETYLDKLIDWLNKNHFDYRGLIEKGLAIDATGLNIY